MTNSVLFSIEDGDDDEDEQGELDEDDEVDLDGECCDCRSDA